MPNSTGPQAPQASQRRGDREPRTAAQAVPLPSGPRGEDGERVAAASRPGPQPAGDLGEGSGGLRSTAPPWPLGPPDHPLSQGVLLSQRLRGSLPQAANRQCANSSLSVLRGACPQATNGQKGHERGFRQLLKWWA